jgi:hypothetical protein
MKGFPLLKRCKWGGRVVVVVVVFWEVVFFCFFFKEGRGRE